jgi:4-hydroxyphenylacetate 3-monooxygenase
MSQTLEPAATTRSGKLRTGAEFKASLDDGRKVWVDGVLLDKVADCPALSAGIDLLAEMFDDQFEPEFAEALTMRDEQSGDLVSRAWQLPRTVEDLQARRKLIEYTSAKTGGIFGRPPDLAPTIVVGLMAYLPTFRKSQSAFERVKIDYAENIERYHAYGRDANIIASESLSGPQSDRSAPASAAHGNVKVVGWEKGGVRISGAKSVGSVSAQANDIFFTNLAYPNHPPEACVWGCLPAGTAGIKMISREMLSSPLAVPVDHPLNHKGEEADQLVVFDNVFLPNERIFSLGDVSTLQYYGRVCAWAHWHILTRLAIKAEIFVGSAQLVVDMLGTGAIPAVRGLVADLMEYALALRAFVTAAEHLARPTEGEVMAPDVNMLTAGRKYSIEHYPRIIHTLQELCGQGLVMRFGKSSFDNPEIGHYLKAMLPGHDVSAEVKNTLMNFIWDLTSSGAAGRVELFENVNASPAPYLRERLYKEFDRKDAVRLTRKLALLD